MHATFRQLRVFLALAEHGSITAAAQACHVTQPTASMQLKELSEAVGLPLYEQVGKRLYLTAAGEALADTARAMTEQWSHFEQTVAAMKGHTSGKLRVSLVSTAKYFVPRMLASFVGRYPEIDVAIEVLNRDGVVERLRRNADDLYIMSIPPEDMDLDKQAFLGNPLVVVAAAGHRLANRRRVTLADLADEAFVIREPGSGTRRAGDAHFAQHGFRPKVRMELGSNEAIKQMVSGGLGLGVLSVHALAADPASEGLAILRVDDFPIHANWWVIHPRGKRLSPIASVFLQHLASYREAHARRKRA